MLKNENTGKIMLKKWMFFIAVFCVGILHAQVEFSTSVSKDKLGLNERLRVEFKVNQDGDDFKPPNFEGFRVVGGPNQFVSNQYVNGKRSFLRSYSYTLAPLQKGKLEIGQASIFVDGKEYKTIPVAVNVSEAVDSPTDENNQAVPSTDGVHIIAEVSKSNVFYNEALVVTYKLYVANDTDVGRYQTMDIPTYRGFWNERLDVNANQVNRTTYRGKDYRYVVVDKILLYPQSTGELEITPYTMDVSIAVPTNRRDIFGRRMTTQVNKTVASNSIKINVKDLPTAGKPADFSGAVGDFSLEFNAQRDSVVVNETLPVKLKISGQGNLKLFKFPELELPKALDSYEPERRDNIRTSESGMRGSIDMSYTIIADKPGNYNLGPVSFSFFDPSSETYKTLQTGEHPLVVEPSAQFAQQGGTTSSSSSAQAKNTLGQDIEQFKFIALDSKIKDKKKSTYFIQSKAYWTAFALPLLLLPVFLVIGRKRALSLADTERNQQRQAERRIKKYLSEAESKQDNPTAFYEALELALHNFLKAHLQMDTSEISKERIAELLEDKQVEETTKNDFISLLTSCEMARYAPAAVATTQVNYDKAVAILTDLNKQIK